MPLPTSARKSPSRFCPLPLRRRPRCCSPLQTTPPFRASRAAKTTGGSGSMRSAPWDPEALAQLPSWPNSRGPSPILALACARRPCEPWGASTANPCGPSYRATCATLSCGAIRPRTWKSGWLKHAPPPLPSERCGGEKAKARTTVAAAAREGPQTRPWKRRSMSRRREGMRMRRRFLCRAGLMLQTSAPMCAMRTGAGRPGRRLHSALHRRSMARPRGAA
mmetsp:Transcript_128236/g.369321  ORF Transcript_128236/g.369321 Transcript_128236/m.369321 type:complete len:221 (+) Transcript_128236:250-912(+)